MRNQKVLDTCNIIGHAPISDLPTIAITGARLCSEYGRYMARRLGGEIAKAIPQMQFLSGLSLGVDGIAARAALDQGNNVFAVLGCGADVVYPPENRALYDGIKTMGGIISPYEYGTPPSSNLFHKRNSVVAELADIIVVVEARKKSGNLILVDEAIKRNKKIYVVPGRVTDKLSDGCNQLLKEGAGMITDIDTFISELREGII